MKVRGFIASFLLEEIQEQIRVGKTILIVGDSKADVENIDILYEKFVMIISQTKSEKGYSMSSLYSGAKEILLTIDKKVVRKFAKNQSELALAKKCSAKTVYFGELTEHNFEDFSKCAENNISGVAYSTRKTYKDIEKSLNKICNQKGIESYIPDLIVFIKKDKMGIDYVESIKTKEIKNTLN